MRLFKRMRLVDKYRVEKAKEPNDRGDYILFHESKTLRGCNYQRVFKGSFKECHAEKKRLEKKRLEEIYK
jgi:hypothetical protein